jgi:hypothetical protein
MTGRNVLKAGIATLIEVPSARYNQTFSLPGCRAAAMSGIIEGEDRTQATLFPERI